MATRVVLKAIITGSVPDETVSAAGDVADGLERERRLDPTVLGSIIWVDRIQQTASISIYVATNDHDDAIAAAHSCVISAIIGAGEKTLGWSVVAHPQTCDIVDDAEEKKEGGS